MEWLSSLAAPCPEAAALAAGPPEGLELGSPDRKGDVVLL